MTAAARNVVSSDRRAMLAKVHLAAKELGLDEDARRDVIQRMTGHRSSAELNEAQLGAVIGEFKRLGWTAKPRAAAPAARPGKPRPANHPVALKARAMWISLHHLGVVRSPGEPALEAFAKRQLGVDRLAWADQSQGYRLIEALKKMAERAGWSQDLSMVAPERHVWSLKARLVQRQAPILGLPAVRMHDATEADLDRMAREMGPKVRAMREAEA